MDKVLELSDKDPNAALIYFLSVVIVALCGVVITLWSQKKKEDVKNFNMLIRNIENLKDNANALERLQDKVDSLLKKHD